MDNNSGGNYRVVADEFGKFFERFENFEIEKRNITELQKELMVEARSRGYDTKIMRSLVVPRRRDFQDLAEEEAISRM